MEGDVIYSTESTYTRAVITGRHGGPVQNLISCCMVPRGIAISIRRPGTQLNETSALKRTFRHDHIKPEALKHYIPVMDALARKHMESDWKPGSVLKVVPLSKKYTFDLACEMFPSVVDAEDVKKLFDPFTLVTKGMFSLLIDIPGTAYNRAIKGGEMVREGLLRIIKQRRKELMEGATVTRFDTIVVNYLAQLPHIYEDVLKEEMEVARSKGPDELLTWEDIEKMKYSWNVAREPRR
ncbi:hypothetical protein ACS0TY_028046 [Phlomoides rotata]